MINAGNTVMKTPDTRMKDNRARERKERTEYNSKM